MQSNDHELFISHSLNVKFEETSCQGKPVNPCARISVEQRFSKKFHHIVLKRIRQRELSRKHFRKGNEKALETHVNIQVYPIIVIQWARGWFYVGKMNRKYGTQVFHQTPRFLRKRVGKIVFLFTCSTKNWLTYTHMRNFQILLFPRRWNVLWTKFILHFPFIFAPSVTSCRTRAYL